MGSYLTRRFQAGVCALSLMATTCAAAQAPARPARDYWRDLKAAEITLAAARLAADKLPVTEDGLDARRELLATPLQRTGNLRMFAGDADGALAALDEFNAIGATPRAPLSRADVARLAAAHQKDAIAAIVDAARARRIVILNESHHVPLHRAFAMALAKELRKIGFAYLACETFEPPHKDQHYISHHTGYYSNDPVFANFLRAARQDNWTFIDYDVKNTDDALPFEDQVDAREGGAARNLHERIFKRDPAARVLLYVGLGHGRKNGAGKARALGARLKQMTGYDPLSVNQIMIAHTYPGATDALYRQLVKKGGDRPFVLQHAQGRFEQFGSNGGYDIEVIHPDYGIHPDTGRPAWMHRLAGMVPRQVPTHLLPDAGRRLVQAFRPGSALDEVALDAVLVEAGLGTRPRVSKKYCRAAWWICALS